ncbi:hypothetical protein ACFY8O_14985 [Streptomyces argenteolus]|uniref:PH (Pleckstrin Homology) domain-containing protein n=1 Tax=Streptomyces argenteolus TaxID=67274 RepID=A0ABW6X570_9ACTN
MQHHSTPVARAVGAATLLSAAAAWGAASLQSHTDGPRWDILVPLGLASAFVVGWLHASRSAPLVRPLPATAPPQTTIPGKLGVVRRDWGLVAAAYLTVWAPFAAANSAFYSGRSSELGAVYCLLTFVLGVVSSLCLLSLLQSYLDHAQHILRKDAAAGGVHAVRVRFGTAVQEAYRYPAGNGGRIAVKHSYSLELTSEDDTDGQHVVRLQAVHAGHGSIVSEKHLTHAAAQLVAHAGWLCWPTRWRDVAEAGKARTVSAAFVSDSGHVVWGATLEEDHRYYLHEGAAPVCETDTALSVTPIPRPSRYFVGTHASHLRFAAAGALLAVPFLLDVAPRWASLLLGLISGAVGLLAGMTMDGVGVDQEPWTRRETSHPSLQ